MGPTDPHDPNVLRIVRIGTPPAPGATDNRYTLWTWDAGRRYNTGQYRVGRRLVAPDGTVVFEGEDCGIAPAHAIDSDDALADVLSWCVLKPGDTDADFFADYTPEQLAFAESAACETMALAVYDYEEAINVSADHGVPARRIFHDVYACHGCGDAPDKPAPKYCDDPWRHTA